MAACSTLCVRTSSSAVTEERAEVGRHVPAAGLFALPPRLPDPDSPVPGVAAPIVLAAAVGGLPDSGRYVLVAEMGLPKDGEPAALGGLQLPEL